MYTVGSCYLSIVYTVCVYVNPNPLVYPPPPIKFPLWKPKIWFQNLFFFFCLFFAISRAAPAAYGGSQARGRIGAVATGLRQSQSNAGSEPRLQPTPQLMAAPDRQPTEQGQGPNPQPHSTLPQHLKNSHTQTHKHSHAKQWKYKHESFLCILE